MKFGNYDLGTPIEVGITGNNNFYYPLHQGAPLLSSQQSEWDASNMDYTITAHNPNYKYYYQNTSMYDYKQQFVSPGTAYGYGRKLDTDNAPYVNASQTISKQLTDLLLTTTHTGQSYASVDNYTFAGLAFQGMSAQEAGNNSNFDNLLTGINTRYNPIYHSSLFTELVTHNVKNAQSEQILANFFNSYTIETLTKLLFAGTFSTDNQSTPFEVNTQNFKFVESGMPYVKFRIQSNVVDENGIPVGTSDNDVGYIDYYVMMRTINHFDSNPDDLSPFTPVNEFNNNNSQVLIQEILDNYFDVGMIQHANIPGYRFEMNQATAIIPTIIADFRNPTYSVTPNDANIDVPGAQGGGYQDKYAFPFPGQYNPLNEPNKAPNSGAHYYDELFGEGTGEIIDPYAEMEASFLAIGAHPYFFTFDNLYMQDYDILGEFGDNPSFGFMQMKFYDIGWVQDTYSALAAVITELQSVQYSPDDENIIKVKVMFNRLFKWYGVLTSTTGTDGPGDFTSYYDQHLLASGNTFNRLNFSPSNETQTDQFQANWSALMDYFDINSHTFNTLNVHSTDNPYCSIYKLADTFSPPGLRMFGPPAPLGYVPRCGVNYRNYFGLDASYETSEPPTMGNTNFVFNGGLDVGSVVSLDNALGYDSSQITSEIENYSGDIDVLASKLFDRELWKLFYDVQQMIGRDYGSDASISFWGTTAPTTYIQFNYSGEPQTFRDTLTPEEQKKFDFCYNFNLYTDGLDTIYNGALPNYTYQTITTLFTGGFIGNAGVNTLTGQPINPYIDESYNLLEQSHHRTRIRSLLLQTPPLNGGIQNFEIGLWINWLKSGCTQNYPTPHISPAVTSPQLDVFGVNQYGTFVGSTAQILIPLPGTNYIDIDLNTSIPFTTNNWWQICNYLNQFEELKNGSISFISEIPIEDSSEFSGTNNTTQNVILFSSNYVTGDNESIASFYPANQAQGMPPGFFTQGSKIRVHFGSSYGNFSQNSITPIYTEAFGPPSETLGFETGTTFIQMINELVMDGIEGQQIDCYPYNPNDVSGDGIYDLQDGYEWLTITGNTGTPDYRPLQLIGYALENNLMDVLTSFLPPSSSPFVAGDTLDYDVLEPNPNKFPLSPLAVGTFDGVNSAASIYYNSITSFRNESQIGAFSNGPGTIGMQKNILTDNGYQNKGHSEAKGTEITTGSRNVSNHPYFFPVVINHDKLNEFNSEEFFDVSFGHISGEGSLSTNNGKTPSEAIYRQAANELLGNPSGSFYSVSQSIKNQINANTEPDYMSETPDPDEYVWILKVKQNKMDDSARLSLGFRLNLSGSLTTGAGKDASLSSGARLGSTGAAAYVVQENGLARYYITSGGTTNLQTKGVYGYWYPEIGTAVINPKIGELITGGAGTTVTGFNQSGAAHNGMIPSGLTKTDKEYNNSLKLINCLKNKGNLTAIQNFRFEIMTENKLNVLACIKLKANEFNFTTNYTRFVNMNPEDGFDTFNDTMKFNDVSRTSPTTYITHVDLYDTEGYRVATAKLSKPIKKDFNSEVIIKIMIKDI